MRCKHVKTTPHHIDIDTIGPMTAQMKPKEDKSSLSLRNGHTESEGVVR